VSNFRGSNEGVKCVAFDDKNCNFYGLHSYSFSSGFLKDFIDLIINNNTLNNINKIVKSKKQNPRIVSQYMFLSSPRKNKTKNEPATLNMFNQSNASFSYISTLDFIFYRKGGIIYEQ
jgi:hypothetical protein